MMLSHSKSFHRQEEKTLNNSKLSPDEALALINKLTRTPLEKEQVYSFTVTLCDNEVDRDFERFSTGSLGQLEKLFLGRTGISDHSMRSKDQAARIFRTYIYEDSSRLTSCGEKYTALKADAYMVRTDSNADLIKEIEGGIKKEVSIGCAAGKVICSICGKNMKAHECAHIKGKTYKGKLCHGILSDISDAYEWSFVAVPAQRNAGVTKSFKLKEEPALNTVDIIKAMTEDTLITPSQAKEVCDYISSLEKMAQEAAAYKQHLVEDVARYALIIMPKVDTKQFTENCTSMDVSSLRKFRDDLAKQAKATMPVSLQLTPSQDKKTPDNKDFII
ncbi:MAG: hypothetical protein IIX36_03625 [Clostridia bacterium]|nr:hypothetical protein [Clostridia bacterium]